MMKEGVFCSLSRKRKSILRGFRSAKLAPFVDINLDADDEEKKSAREREREIFFSSSHRFINPIQLVSTTGAQKCADSSQW